MIRKTHTPLKLYLIATSIVISLVYCTYYITGFVFLDDDVSYENSNKYKESTVKADQNISNKELTPLIAAAMDGNYKTIDSILQNGGKKLINQQKCSGCGGTALHHAITSKNIKTVELLLQNGADVDSFDKDKESPYMKAFYYAENPAVMDLLVKYGAKKIKFTYSNALMDSALKNSNLVLFKRLLTLGGKINYQDKKLNTPLHIIAKNSNDTVFAEYLIQRKVDVNSRNKSGETPLMLALESKNYSMIKYLLNHQTNLDQKDSSGNSLLNQVIKADCQPEIVQKLISKGINTAYDFNNGFEIIKYMVNHNDSILTFKLINRETDWSFSDKYSLAMFNWGIRSNRSWLKKAFIKKNKTLGKKALEKLKANYKLNNNFADFIKALLKNEKIPAEFYLSNGFSPDTKDKSGYTPLIIVIENYYASRHYDHDAHLGEKNFDLLIKYKANVNLADNDGWTPLMYAAAYGYDEPISKLIKAGANIKIKNKDGKTALELYLNRNKDSWNHDDQKTISFLKGGK